MMCLVHTRNDSFNKTCQKKNVCFEESRQKILLFSFVHRWLWELTHCTSGSQGVHSCGNSYPEKCLEKVWLKIGKVYASASQARWRRKIYQGQFFGNPSFPWPAPFSQELDALFLSQS